MKYTCTIYGLLELGIMPIINENDAVSANQGYQLYGNSFSDNDSLASMVAVETDAHVLILLTDVEGVYDRPPTEPDASLIDIFTAETGFKEGTYIYHHFLDIYPIKFTTYSCRIHFYF